MKAKTNKPTVLDVFCGAGGMSLGFQNAGCKILGGIDKNPHAIRTHHRNFPTTKLQLIAQQIEDINLLALPIKPSEVDILIGGPPCQVFSIVGLGKMKSLGKKIENDPRNILYKYFINFLYYYQPLAFVIENVNTLKSNKVFSQLLAELEHGLSEFQNDYPGYNIKSEILIASNYGVPQLRKRLFIVGLRKNTKLTFRFPDPSTIVPVSVGDAIGDLPPLKPISIPLMKKSSAPRQSDRLICYQSEPQSKYQEIMRKKNRKTTGVMNHICRAHNEKDLEIFEMLAQGGKYRDLPQSVKRYRDDIFEDKYKRLKWDEPSWTLTAHMQKDCLAYIHPTQTRSISVREAARIQSFPDNFVFDAPMTRMFELVGNSVPPLLAEAVAEPLVKLIKAYKTSI